MSDENAKPDADDAAKPDGAGGAKPEGAAANGAAEPRHADSEPRITKEQYEAAVKAMNESQQRAAAYEQQNLQWQRHWQEFNAEKAAKEDPVERARAKVVSARLADDAVYEQAQREYEEALGDALSKRIDERMTVSQRATMAAMEGRRLAEEFGVTERDMGEVLDSFRNGNPDMATLAKMAAIRKGTYEKAIERNQTKKEQEAAMAGRNGSGADGPARSGPGRAAQDTAAKPDYNYFRAASFLNGDGSVRGMKKDAFRAYLATCDPETVPQEYASLLGR